MTTSTHADLSTNVPSARPRCECLHRSPLGEEECGRPAGYRVTLICVIEDCDHAALVLLACACCLRGWEAAAAHNPDAPQMRVRRI
ncbi:hypothetical protein [Nocardioides pyridinolyticus]